jgi:hypothetical protein
VKKAALYAWIFAPWTLGLLFTVLKLTHVIAWSWAAVTAPIWLPLAVGAVLIVGLVVLSEVHDYLRTAQPGLRDE